MLLAFLLFAIRVDGTIATLAAFAHSNPYGYSHHDYLSNFVYLLLIVYGLSDLALAKWTHPLTVLPLLILILMAILIIIISLI